MFQNLKSEMLWLLVAYYYYALGLLVVGLMREYFFTVQTLCACLARIFMIKYIAFSKVILQLTVIVVLYYP